MRSKNLLSLFALAISFGLGAQTPYFQQDVHYKIDVKLNDVNHSISAFETFTYTNNSTSTLNEMWIHIWPNAYKNNETAFAIQQLKTGSTAFQFAGEDKRGHIDSLSFSVDGVSVPFEYHPVHQDICKINLPKPLAPGQTITVATPFKVKIPSSEFSRLGHNDQQYQLCQWYPKPAVFDKNGWNPMPYLSQGEFYSEFGSYEVKITLPRNYVVAASGELQPNPQEEADIRANIEETMRLSKSGFPKTDSFPASSSTLKTVVYKIENAHDFAWFVDKRYHITTSAVALPITGKMVTTYGYFTNRDAEKWKEVTTYVNDAVYHYSELVGEYPYSVCKAVDGALTAGAGMEYPTITIISADGDAKSLDNVTTHEVGHNWFYGILATNEREHPWMDEGMNSYYETRYMEKKYPNFSFIGGLAQGFMGKALHLKVFRPEDLRNTTYLFCARRNRDQPLNLSSDDYTTLNYGAMIYQKTGSVMAYLEAWLGTERFDEMMRSYYDTWKFKHPTPEDFKAHVQAFTGQPLDWFFGGLLESAKRVDYKITKVSKPGVASFVKVKNVGQIASPVSVTGIKADSSLTMWYEGFEGSSKLSFPVGYFERYSVNYTGRILDYNPKNDEMTAKGLFKKWGKPQLSFLSGLEHPRNSSLYLAPTLGYNAYNGFMAGLAFHNVGIIRKKFEYVINPMFGFETRTLIGQTQLDYFVRPVNAFFRDLTFTASAERFAANKNFDVSRVVAGASMEFLNRKKGLKKSAKLGLRHIYINETFQTINFFDGSTINAERNSNYTQLTFRYTNARVLNPYSVFMDMQYHEDFVKASLTAFYKINYQSKKKGLLVRFFAGSFLWKSNTFATAPDARFRLSGQTGAQDYLYDNIYLGRNETSGVLSQQMMLNDGGFKVLSFRGQTSDYLATLNLSTTLPGKIPVRLFADIGHYSNGEKDADPINYSLGASLVLVPDFFEIHFPMLNSRRIKETLELNKVTFGEQIRFVLNFRIANPITQLRQIDL